MNFLDEILAGISDAWTSEKAQRILKLLNTPALPPREIKEKAGTMEELAAFARSEGLYSSDSGPHPLRDRMAGRFPALMNQFEIEDAFQQMLQSDPKDLPTYRRPKYKPPMT
jgi:hypothetical protein